MPLNSAALYDVHVKNLRAVNTACEQVYRQLKFCLAGNQQAAADALLKTFTLLLGAWAEVRLLKLLYEPNGFTDDERTKVFSGPSKLDQWKISLELGFRRRYGIPTADLTQNSLPKTAYLRYGDMISLLDVDLKPIIEIRNKLAHGQWARTLNSEMNEISQPMMVLLNTENALSGNFKKQILETISQLAHDLVTTNDAFERDFDPHYKILTQAKTNLQKRSYTKWLAMMNAKLDRGRQRRAANP